MWSSVKHVFKITGNDSILCFLTLIPKLQTEVINNGDDDDDHDDDDDDKNNNLP